MSFQRQSSASALSLQLQRPKLALRRNSHRSAGSKINLRAGESLAEDTKKQEENALAMAKLHSTLNATASRPSTPSGGPKRGLRRALSRSIEPSEEDKEEDDEVGSPMPDSSKGKMLMLSRKASNLSDRKNTKETKRVKRNLERFSSSGPAEDATEIHRMLMDHFKVRHMNTNAENSKDVRKESVELARANKLLPHNEVKYQRWNVAVLVLVLWEFAYLPWLLSFESTMDSSGRNARLIMDLCCDFLYLLDVCVQFFVARPAFEDELQQAPLLTDYADIRNAYLNAWDFGVDFVCCVPFHLLPGNIVLCRLPRFFRLLKVRRISFDMTTNHFFRRTMVYSPMSSFFRLGQLISVIVFIVHWCICIWHAVTREELGGVWLNYELHERATKMQMCFKGEGLCANDDAAEGDGEDSFSYIGADDAFSRYSLCFQAVMRQIFGGESVGVTNTESVVGGVMTMFGGFVMAITYGNVAVLVASFFASSSGYKQKMQLVWREISRLQLSTELSDRVFSYYEYVYCNHGSLSGKINTLIPELPRSLASEVLLCQRISLITKVPFFAPCQPEMLQALILKLEDRISLPSDFVVVKGEFADAFYLIRRGYCALHIEQANSMMITIQQGGSFGENALVSRARRNASVYACVFCEFCVLRSSVYDEVAELYPDSAQLILNYIVQKQQQRQEEAEKKRNDRISQHFSTNKGAPNARRRSDADQGAGDKINIIRRQTDVLSRAWRGNRLSDSKIEPEPSEQQPLNRVAPRQRAASVAQRKNSLLTSFLTRGNGLKVNESSIPREKIQFTLQSPADLAAAVAGTEEAAPPTPPETQRPLSPAASPKLIAPTSETKECEAEEAAKPVEASTQRVLIVAHDANALQRSKSALTDAIQSRSEPRLIVDTARSAEEAWEHIQQRGIESYDGFFTDLLMPKVRQPKKRT